jgi:hypothetical protein
MESVRWLRAAKPGANSMTRKIVPFGNVVPVLRNPASPWAPLSTGKTLRSPDRVNGRAWATYERVIHDPVDLDGCAPGRIVTSDNAAHLKCHD